MFAVIKTGGKQFRVAQDDVIVVEKLDAEAGDKLVFGDVLMLGDGDKFEMGGPMIGGAQVVGEVVEQRRAAKIIIFKKKRRSTYKRKQGHRQHETVIRITDILAKGGADASAKSAAKPKVEKKTAAPKVKAAKADKKIAGATPAKAPRAKKAAAKSKE